MNIDNLCDISTHCKFEIPRVGPAWSDHARRLTMDFHDLCYSNGGYKVGPPSLVYNLGDGLWVFMVDIVYRIHVVSKTTPHIFLQGGP